MQKNVLLVVLIVAVFGLSLLMKGKGGDSPSGPKGAELVGMTAPDFSLQSNQGGEIRLSDLKGKVVMLNLWATWCPPCRDEMPSMETLHQQLKGENFVMLAVNIEENGPEVVPGFLKQNPHSFPVLYDTKRTVQELYGVDKFPETFVIGKNGKVLDHIIGAREWSHPNMVNYFKDLARGN